MRILEVVVACAIVSLATGCAVPADAGGPASAHAAPRPHATTRASDPIAVVGVTLKTDLEAIYETRPDGSRSHQLPVPASLLPEAVAWSPDGKQLAIVAGGIFVVGADGRGFRLLTPAALNTGSSVSWSPDGKWIAFTGYAYRYDSAAYVIRPDGTGLHQVLKRFDVDSLAWGPDDRLAILGRPHHPAPLSRHAVPPAGVWTVAVDGTHAAMLAGPNAGFTGLYGWSPDGGRLLLGSARGLSSIPAAGGRPRLLLCTQPRTYLAAAALSPDGEAIIVAINPIVTGVAPIRYYRIPAAGGRRTSVALPPMRYVSSLAWQQAG